MDMTGSSTNNTEYTGAVCMSITVVGNTTDLPLSDPFCNTDACLAFKAAHAESQSSVSYYRQFDYGHFTTWFYLVCIGVAILAYAARLYRNNKPPRAPDRPGTTAASLRHKVVSGVRFVRYRSVGGVIAARFGMTGLGMLAFLVVSWLLFFLMTFWEHPYYRSRRGYGSPPLGVRAGLMSTALTPVIVALSGKANFITLLTGISHEKLNVVHRWASYLCLFLAVVHTVPFLVIAVDRCGSDGLRAQFYKPNAYEYTGVPPLGMLVGLCVLSVPWIRHRFYNFFYRLHIPMYITYLGLMFWHAGNQQDSWAYLWATLAIWLASTVIRLFFKWQTFNVNRNWFSGFQAQLKDLPGDMTQVSVFVPGDLRWKPGQHCFLRMPHVSVLQNHPYTIANLPGDSRKGSDYQEMTFYVRAHRGLTRRLLNSVADHRDRALSLHLDGPYGGLVENLPALYQSLIFVAGGSGVSACLPHMLQAARSVRAEKDMVKHIYMVWMVRHPSHTQWVLDKLQQVCGSLAPGALRINVYITDSALAGSSDDTAAEEESSRPGSKSSGKKHGEGPEKESVRQDVLSGPTPLQDIATVHHRRPFLPDLLPGLVDERRVCIFGCGPQSLLLDLGNAVAKEQGKVMRGEADTIALHMERFSW